MLAPVIPPVVRVQGLTKRFGPVTAVDNLSFTLQPGETVGLLGGNGAGKTTTITMLLGLLLPSAGSVEVLGADMLSERHKVLHRINFSSPYVELPRRLTTRENLSVYANLYEIPDVRGQIARLAEELALESFLDRPLGTLSAGQRCRVALAKALLNEPALLLLDELTASLDPDTADWVRGFLERYRARTAATILLASHNMWEVERLCTDVLMMRAGRIVDRGSPRALIQRYGKVNLEEVFLDIARAEGQGAARMAQRDAEQRSAAS
jgi:ABC-2 type transport system ATP-binding protein